MTKELIKAKANEITSMSACELSEFGITVDMSSVDAKSKAYLYRAIEDRQLQLIDIEKTESISVVDGDLREGEL